MTAWPGLPASVLAADATVPGLWRGLGLPGLVDVHVHFLPPRMLAAVWAYFDEASEHYGVDWPVTYRVGDEQRVALLRRLGVRAFPALAPQLARALPAAGVGYGYADPMWFSTFSTDATRASSPVSSGGGGGSSGGSSGGGGGGGGGGGSW